MRNNAKLTVVALALTIVGAMSIYAGDVYKYQNSKHSGRMTLSCSENRLILARITAYWAVGSDTDKWSRRHQSSTGARLEEGISAAVDPGIIPYGSTLFIPGVGTRTAQDTGTAVISRKASNGKMPVIDVFFEHKSDALDYARSNPSVQEVEVR